MLLDYAVLMSIWSFRKWYIRMCSSNYRYITLRNSNQGPLILASCQKLQTASCVKHSISSTNSLCGWQWMTQLLWISLISAGGTLQRCTRVLLIIDQSHLLQSEYGTLFIKDVTISRFEAWYLTQTWLE